MKEMVLLMDAREEGKEEGRKEGREEGSVIRLILLIQKKVDKSKSLNVIADELESDEVEIRPLYEAVLKYGADARPEEVLQKMKEANERNLLYIQRRASGEWS